MKVAVVLLNYNDSKNTIRFSKKLESFDVINKIIIVDNNSKLEGEVEKLSSLESEKIHFIGVKENKGYSYGNNVGLKYLDEIKYNPDYVIISNPDVDTSKEAILKTIDYLENHEKCAVATPRMKYISGYARRAAWKRRKFLIDVANSTRITELLLYFLFKKGEYTKDDYKKENMIVDCVSGAFFIAKYDIFKSIGFFDENTFLFFEEDILNAKLYERGYNIAILNDCYFMHYDSQSIGKFVNAFKKQDIMFDSRIYYQKKYNNINLCQVALLNFLRYVRKFELLFEIPIRKIFSK